MLADAVALTHADRWPGILAAAVLHGVDGLILDALDSEPELAATLPGDALRAARANLLRRRSRMANLRDTLWRVLESAAAAGVRLLPLKGPCLAARAWPAGTERPSEDLDLLAHPDDMPAAVAWLRGRGWRPIQPEHETAASPHVAFVGPESERGALLELHRAPGVAFGLRWPVRDLFANAVPWSAPGGPACRVLAPDDEWLVLAVHGTQHQFARLMWLVDLAQLPGVNHHAVARRARSLGAAAVVHFSRHELATTLGVQVPEWTDATDATNTTGARQHLARWIAGSVHRGHPFTRAATFRRLAFQLCLASRLDSLWRLAHTALARARART